MCDNDTAFRSRYFASFAARWSVTLRFRAAHVPSGNGIVERNHRTVKVIAARKQCSIAEAVHLYNVAPRDDGDSDDSPVARVYRYAVRDCVQPGRGESAVPECDSAPSAAGAPPPGGTAGLTVGDSVWVRQRGMRCTELSRRGTVTGIVSEQVVTVDGIPRHVRDLRRCVDQAPPCHECHDDVDTDLPLYVDASAPTAPVVTGVSAPQSSGVSVPQSSGVSVPQSSGVSVPQSSGVSVAQSSGVSVPQSSVRLTEVPGPVPSLRRSQRVRRPPRRWCCDHDGQGGVCE